MPPRGQGPRLQLRPARRDGSGRVTHPATWRIIDGRHQRSTSCRADDRGGAERALATYIAEKHVAQAGRGQRDPSRVPVADVISVYGKEVAKTHARPKETAQRIKALLGFFGTKRLSDINGSLCRSYIASRSTDAAARRELEDLRAAVNHYHREGHIRESIKITLPDRPEARDRWLTRSEAARLIWTAWRYRERQNAVETIRYPRKHIARFIIVGLYTGRRASAICEAALEPATDRGWIDLKHGIFYPRPRRKESKKRQPKIVLPRRLLGHLRRWKKAGQRYAVEWYGEPVLRVSKGFAATVKTAKLGKDVTPHVLRHTAPTWMMQRAAPIWDAAGYLGMSPEVLIRVYGHHHPDHLKGAWSVFDRPGGTPKAPQKVPGALKRKPRPRRPAVRK